MRVDVDTSPDTSCENGDDTARRLIRALKKCRAINTSVFFFFFKPRGGCIKFRMTVKFISLIRVGQFN